MDLYQKIATLELFTKRMAENVLVGSYHSAFKGAGLDFEELRPYQPGDAIRTIDWNVTAKMGVPYTKVFKEEREVPVTLIVDISRSTTFQQTKEQMAEVASLLAFSALQNNDQVSLILCSDKVELYLPPRKGRSHLLKIIEALLSHQPTSPHTNLNAALQFLGHLKMKSGICFLISDFLSEIDETFLHLTAKKQDLITILFKNNNTKLPSVGLLKIKDLETNHIRIIDTSDPDFQNTFAKKRQQQLDTHRALLKKIGAEGIEISSDQNSIDPIKAFFKKRKK